MVQNPPANNHGKPGPCHGAKITLFPLIVIIKLVMRAAVLCKWPKPAALSKADRRFQFAIAAIFVCLGKRMNDDIITQCMLPKALANHHL